MPQSCQEEALGTWPITVVSDVAFVSPKHTKPPTRGHQAWREEKKEVVSGYVLILEQ